MIIIAIFMIVIVKSWLIIISSYIAIVHVTTVDVLRAHAPSKMVQMPAALADLANMRWWSLDWIGLDYPCADDPVPISVLQEAIFILLLVEVPAVLGANRNVVTQHLRVPLWWWWWCTKDEDGHGDDFFGPNLVTHHLGVLLWWWWWCTKQGGIKCGKRGRGFLDSEGSHW